MNTVLKAKKYLDGYSLCTCRVVNLNWFIKKRQKKLSLYFQIQIWLRPRKNASGYSFDVHKEAVAQVFWKKGVLRNFAKFKRKQLRQSLFWFQACNFIKKEALAQVFSFEFCKIFKNTSSYMTPPVAASGHIDNYVGDTEWQSWPSG